MTSINASPARCGRLRTVLVVAVAAGAAFSPYVLAGVDDPDQVVEVPTPFAIGDFDGVALSVTAAADIYEQVGTARNILMSGFPIAPDRALDLELERFWIDVPDAEHVDVVNGAPQRVDAPRVALFKGRVVGVPESDVFLGLSNDVCSGVVRVSDQEEYFLTTAADWRTPHDGVRHVLYERLGAFAGAEPVDWKCATDQLPLGVDPFGVNSHVQGSSSTGAAGGGDDPGSADSSFRSVWVAIDTDYEFYEHFGSSSAARSYVYELLAYSSRVYERDTDTKLAVVYTRIWTNSDDPWNKSEMDAQLDQFRNYWEEKMGNIDRNVAHLLQRRSLGGGLAIIYGACGPTLGYGLSSGLNCSFPRPLRDNHEDNWDIIVVPHELGHNLSSPHTHCYVPPVDKCWNDEPFCFDGDVECTSSGTIMSYCHQCAGGVENIDLRFGSRVSNAIHDWVHGIASCIRQARNPAYVDKSNDGFQDGTEGSPYNTVREGIRIVEPGKSVYIKSGSYDETFQVHQPMVLRATDGDVVIGE